MHARLWDLGTQINSFRKTLYEITIHFRSHTSDEIPVHNMLQMNISL